MSVKFSKEIQICNLLRSYLNYKNAIITQLIVSGAQATYSITYTSKETGKKKTIFPDLIAIIDNFIIVGEIKPKYSVSDEKKLVDLKLSSDGETKVRLLIQRYLNLKDTSSLGIKFVLIHGDESVVPNKFLHQLIVSASDVKQMSPEVRNLLT